MRSAPRRRSCSWTIAEAKPASPAALGEVKGMGPGRLKRYGPEILAVLADS